MAGQTDRRTDGEAEKPNTQNDESFKQTIRPNRLIHPQSSHHNADAAFLRCWRHLQISSITYLLTYLMLKNWQVDRLTNGKIVID